MCETALVCRDETLKSNLSGRMNGVWESDELEGLRELFFPPPANPRAHEGLDYRYNSGRSRLAERSNVKTCQEVKGVGTLARLVSLHMLVSRGQWGRVLSNLHGFTTRASHVCQRRLQPPGWVISAWTWYGSPFELYVVV